MFLKMPQKAVKVIRTNTSDSNKILMKLKSVIGYKKGFPFRFTFHLIFFGVFGVVSPKKWRLFLEIGSCRCPVEEMWRCWVWVQESQGHWLSPIQLCSLPWLSCPVGVLWITHTHPFSQGTLCPCEAKVRSRWAVLRPASVLQYVVRQGGLGQGAQVKSATYI